MARRVKPGTSDGAKKSRSSALRGEATEPAEATSLEEMPATFYAESADSTPSVDAPGGVESNADAQAQIEMGGAEQHINQNETVVPTESTDEDLISADTFDEAGYLRLNPDVRLLIESGQLASGYSHYFWHGRAEGRALPDTPREVRNVMLTSPDEAMRTDVSPVPASSSMEALIIAPNAGLMIVGWIDDSSNPLSCIRITGPNWRVVIDASRLLRVRRMDVEKVVGGGRLHPFGFIGFLQFEQGGDGSGPMQIELWQAGGFGTVSQFQPTFMRDVELRDTILAHVAGAAFFGSPSIECINYLERGIGTELVQFNQSITRRMVTSPYVERFGPQERSPRGTIVVCLYGKSEFFFVQNCLYAGLPGIEDYEFVYVSNSPEMAETLLREARCANLIYGLQTSVMILPGNAGFGAANNAAARIARSDRLLIVNPDVFPRDGDWARKHTDLLRSVPAAQSRLFGVPLYYDDGSLMHGGIYFEIDVGLSLSGGKPSPTRLCRTQHYGKGAPAGSLQFNRARPVPAVTGAFMSIERSWFEQLGGFTEDFIFGHYEDADLCLKSIAEGTAPWIHDIRLWHLEGKGSTRRPHHEGGSIVNRWLFSNTWMAMIEDGLLGPTPTHALMQGAAAPTALKSIDDPAERKVVMHKRVS
jgi:GT2 family glycosyltransferase